MGGLGSCRLRGGEEGRGRDRGEEVESEGGDVRRAAEGVTVGAVVDDEGTNNVCLHADGLCATS